MNTDQELTTLSLDSETVLNEINKITKSYEYKMKCLLINICKDLEKIFGFEELGLDNPTVAPCCISDGNFSWYITVNIPNRTILVILKTGYLEVTEAIDRSTSIEITLGLPSEEYGKIISKAIIDLYDQSR